MWQYVPSNQYELVERIKAPGGWMVKTWRNGAGQMRFVPDPNHAWDGRDYDEA